MNKRQHKLANKNLDRDKISTRKNTQTIKTLKSGWGRDYSTAMMAVHGTTQTSVSHILWAILRGLVAPTAVLGLFVLHLDAWRQEKVRNRSLLGPAEH